MTRILGLKALPTLAALLCLSSSSSSVSTQTSASTACSYLESTLGTGVVLPSEEQYQSTSERNWCVPGPCIIDDYHKG